MQVFIIVIVVVNVVVMKTITTTEKTYEVKVCSHGEIATAIYLSQPMGCMGLSVIVTIVLCEH